MSIVIHRPPASPEPIYLGTRDIALDPIEPHGLYSPGGDRLVPEGTLCLLQVKTDQETGKTIEGRLYPGIPGVSVVWSYGHFGGVFVDGLAADSSRVQRLSATRWELT